MGSDTAWTASLAVDDCSGYKACFDLGVTEVGCTAHYPEQRFMWNCIH